jgi:hypothetical protein
VREKGAVSLYGADREDDAQDQAVPSTERKIRVLAARCQIIIEKL